MRSPQITIDKGRSLSNERDGKATNFLLDRQKYPQNPDNHLTPAQPE